MELLNNAQPEALRLAEELQYLGIDECDAAADELRRLHAANIDCVNYFEAIKAERDELLEALKRFANYPGSICDADYAIARAAIARTEA